MKIIYTQDNGVAAVVTPSPGARLAIAVTIGDQRITSANPAPVDQFLRRWPVEGAIAEWAETEAEFVERIARKDVPQGVAYQIVDSLNIPTDRTFRNAWVAGQGRVEHDIPKCKVIAHEKRRVMRAAELAPLDIEATIPSKAAQAEAARQVIRDKYAVIQAAIDAAQTVEEIKVALQ